MSAIRIEDLHKVFGKVIALDGLSLNVEPGTIFGFLGPNGAGKSTTIRILTGLAHATSGQAWVNEFQVGDYKGGSQKNIAKLIGYLPEEPALYPYMTPSELLEYVGCLFGYSSVERRARTQELLALTGLDGISKRRIGGFSRGIRQRLGLAQALVNRPQILLLDEPVSALDPIGRHEILEMIRSLRGKCTIFMSTHILADVERVCDTVGIINHGRMVVTARQDELIKRYTIPVIELECENGQEKDFSIWCRNLQKEYWIQSMKVEGAVARFVANDLESVRAALLKQAAQSGLCIVRFQIVKPTLEDVFLRLVGTEGRVQ
jgi:ABC-2 type transport system ATP-binding protein